MIRIPEIRVIDSDGKQLGVMQTRDALKLAQQQNLDLVEISPFSKPPVCKVIDYGKYKYELSKKSKEALKKQKVIHLKEIKMRPTIDVHDYQFKVKHMIEFLQKGDKVKVTITFRGREMAHINLGQVLLDKIKEEMKDLIIIEKEPRLEGRNLFMILAGKNMQSQPVKKEPTPENK